MRRTVTVGATEDLHFTGGAGARLSGVLHLPDADAAGSVLLAHCFTCSKDLRTTTRLAKGLAVAGYAVLRFDFTGLGDSEGAFATTTVAHNVRDLVAAAGALIRRGYGPCAMVGHSLGGAATLLAAHRVHTVRSIAVIGAPSSPAHIRRLFAAGDEEAIRRDGEAVVSIGGRPFPLSLAFLDDLERHDEDGEVARLGRPLLVLHAVDDQVVEVAEGERIYGLARQPKAFVPLLDADHLLTSKAASERALAFLVAWFRATL